MIEIAGMVLIGGIPVDQLMIVATFELYHGNELMQWTGETIQRKFDPVVKSTSSNC